MNEKRTRYHPLCRLLLAGALLLATREAWAQSEVLREHVLLPVAVAGTPLSAQIQAEAAYLVARGDLAESAAIARKIHADAFAKEIQNSIGYVDAYFRRRALNRQWRAKENPNQLEREQHLQEVRKRRIEHQFQDALKGDLTGQLNWLLVELSGPTLALHYVAGRVSVADSGGSGLSLTGEHAAVRVPLVDSEWSYDFREPEHGHGPQVPGVP